MYFKVTTKKGLNCSQPRELINMKITLACSLCIIHNTEIVIVFLKCVQLFCVDKNNFKVRFFPGVHLEIVLKSSQYNNRQNNHSFKEMS